jgi:hypothetical protein
MHQFFRGQFFNFESVRILGTARYGGAEVAESLEAIGEIQENDAASWYRAWTQQAKNAENLAAHALRSGTLLSSKSSYPSCSPTCIVTRRRMVRYANFR